MTMLPADLVELDTRLRALAAGPVVMDPQTRRRLRERLSATLRYTSLPSALGRVYVAYSPLGLCALDLCRSDQAFEQAFVARHERAVTRDPHPPEALVRAVRRALRGEPFDGPVDLSLATPFQREVLSVLRQIRRGTIRSYRWIAEQIRRPGAARAVGAACAANPIPLVIPCHRVVRSDGGLGGYSLRGGVRLKRRLLVDEGALKTG